jgi:NAD(P)H-hydrate epimerase
MPVLVKFRGLLSMLYWVLVLPRATRCADYPAAIAQINASSVPVISVDLPSGLDASTGAAAEPCVKANLTCTFIAEKLGLVTGVGPAVAGEVVLDTLAVPDTIFADQTAAAGQLSLSAALSALSPRPANAHKGLFGRCLVVAGSTGMAGAGLIAAEACARMGAGTVTLATAEQNTLAANVRCPEVMAQPVTMGADLEPLLAKCTHLAVGPGLGQAGWGQRMIQASLQAGCATVVDADGLNLLAGKEQVPEHAPGQWILTPHPAEAARLLGINTAQVQVDRAGATRELAQKYQATVVLKGVGSLVASIDGELWVCTQGNPGMASGGMGDVLTGLILGIWPQVNDPVAAAKLAVVLHACAADNLAAEQGQRGLLATDLIPQARRLINSGQ